jgi:hypothetical protein
MTVADVYKKCIMSNVMTDNTEWDMNVFKNNNILKYTTKNIQEDINILSSKNSSIEFT